MNGFVTLSNGVRMPRIGFGTYKATDGRQEESIRLALDTGYRLLDTAAFYFNEELVGKAICESGVPREEIFLTSKVWKTELGYDKTKASLEASMERLGVDYLDLFLLHWPKPEPDTPDWKELDRESWRVLEEFYRQGKVRAIGLSNFLPHHIEALLSEAQIRPMVDQLELHVGYLQETAVQYCRKAGIQVQAWSPLGRARALQDPTIRRMAEKYQVSEAQLLLGFLLDQDICVIPKASSKERLIENLEVPQIPFSLEDRFLLQCLPQMGWSGEHPDLPRVK